MTSSNLSNKKLRKDLNTAYDCTFCDGTGKMYNLKNGRHQKCPHLEVIERIVDILQAAQHQLLTELMEYKQPMSKVVIVGKISTSKPVTAVPVSVLEQFISLTKDSDAQNANVYQDDASTITDKET